ncbi:class I SAM-dependent methyltransferase [soil metagenome]
MPADPTKRFAGRVADYARYRPAYPEALLDFLEAEGGLREGARVADVGAGTGIFSRQLAGRGAHVVAVEPNAEMLAASGCHPSITPHLAPAENLGLQPAAFDLVTVAQAFHWFDRGAFRSEAASVLRRGGTLAVIWNERLTDATPFLAGYENLLLRYGTDYQIVNHAAITAGDMAAFFAPATMRIATFPHAQDLDLKSLTGRVFSSSYTPPPGHPNHQPLRAALRHLFAQHATNALVRFEYRCIAYIAHL